MHHGCSESSPASAGPMISIGKVRDADYYLAETHADDVHHYYAGNERLGVWAGSFAEAQGLRGSVDPNEFHSLIGGFNPKTGERLTATATRVPAFDLAASLDKGSSLV